MQSDLRALKKDSCELPDKFHLDLVAQRHEQQAEVRTLSDKSSPRPRIPPRALLFHHGDPKWLDLLKCCQTVGAFLKACAQRAGDSKAKTVLPRQTARQMVTGCKQAPRRGETSGGEPPRSRRLLQSLWCRMACLARPISNARPNPLPCLENSTRTNNSPDGTSLRGQCSTDWRQTVKNRADARFSHCAKLCEGPPIVLPSRSRIFSRHVGSNWRSVEFSTERLPS